MDKLEIESCLLSLKVLVDTREQPSERARRRYEDFGCAYERRTLAFGDYTYNFETSKGWHHPAEGTVTPEVTIERKMNLDELAACFTHDRKRFKAEMQRAKEAGAKIYLLVENANWENLINGGYRSRFSPKAYLATMTAWMARYNMQVIFCKSETSGKLIKEILYRELKEKLEGGLYG